MRPKDRDRVFELNAKGTRIVLEEALAAGVERVVHASSVAAIGPAKPGGTADEDQAFRAGEPGHRLRQLQARGRGRGAAARRARAFRGDRQPVVRPRPGRSEGDVDGARTPLPAGSHPGLRGRRAQHRRRARCRSGPSARRRKGREGRALHPGRTQLHARPAVRRLRQDLGTGASGEAAGRADVPRGRGDRAGRACRSRSRPTRSARRVNGGPIATPRHAGSWGSSPGRTRRRSRTPCAGRCRQLGDRVRQGRAPQEAAVAAVAPLLRLGERVLGL